MLKETLSFPRAGAVRKRVGILLLSVVWSHAAHSGADGSAHWVEVPSPRGVHALELQLDPLEPRNVFVQTPAGIYRSTRGGDRWMRLTGSPGGGDTGRLELAVDPLDPRVLYGIRDDRVFRSRDRGITWSKLGPRYINGVIAHGVTAPTSIYAWSLDGAVFRSTDSGETWTDVGLDSTWELLNLTPDPVAAGTVYATTTDGIYRTVDSGTHWTRISLAGTEVRLLVIDPMRPSVLYALVRLRPEYRIVVYRSKDRGASWEWLESAPSDGNSELLVTDPSNSGSLYLSTGTGLFVSTDYGDNWSMLDAFPGSTVHSFAISPRDSAELYAGTSTGVFKSADGGQRWRSLHEGLPRLGIAELAASLHDPRTFYVVAGSRHGFGSGVFRTGDGGRGWTQRSSGAPEHVYDIESHPTLVNWLYALDSLVDGVMLSSTGGRGWRVSELGNVYAIAPSPADPELLYAAGEGFWRSEDGGATWQTKTEPVQGADATSIRAHPTDRQAVYAICETGDGRSALAYTPDGGATWQRRSVPPWGISQVWIDPDDGSTLFAASWDDGLAKSTNGGITWSPTKLLIPAISELAFLPGGTIYAASQAAGVFGSGDGGDTWGGLNGDLPVGGVGDVKAIASQSGVTLLALSDESDRVYRLEDAGSVELEPIRELAEGRRR